jgi:ADP-glucose pyrophosphorylase
VIVFFSLSTTIAGCVVGDRASVGEGAAVTGSVLAPEVQLGARCVLDGLAVVGEGTTVAPDNRLAKGIKVAPYSALSGGQITF